MLQHPAPGHAEGLARHRRLLASAREGLATDEALLSRVWSIPGDLHPLARCGRIERRCLANLAAWDLDHPSLWPGDRPLRTLAMGDPLGALQNVMTAGSWRAEHGAMAELTRSERYREHRREASERLAALLKRI
jgi:hypothetical protein